MFLEIFVSSSRENELDFVPNSPGYWEFIRELRTNRFVMEGFISQVDISAEEQRDYMRRHASRYFVCLYNGKPAGYVGVVENDIRIAVHPDFQRMGIGSYMLRRLVEHYPLAEAKIKIDNEASLRLFERAGFRKQFFVLQWKGSPEDAGT
jgi:RimJ/RimL family protein N-acetyltransferase